MIRQLSVKDAPQLQVINEKSLGYAITLEECQKHLEAVLKNDDHILIGYTDGCLI
ncbi:hypothetical protein P7H30_04185 [Streptococcus parauberis]|uniref:hypothetical protein n=1 Tax=Streptococcus parauberis TaxID=1348 RepID=UPI0028916A2F|nr:hypothetical protein [Streptococcus parauberis]MDT2748948.1 hypothetical protein [Streptococcus parauberis]